MQIGRGKGKLPLEGGLLCLDNPRVHVSAVKPAERGSGVVVRLFNAADKPERIVLRLHEGVRAVMRCGMDETVRSPVRLTRGLFKDTVPPHRIVSYLLEM